MPSKPPSACRRPGCRGLVRGGVCSVCGPLRAESNWDAYHRDRNATSRHQRGYGRNWEKLRTLILANAVFCRQCAAHGLVVLATTVDHIIPKSWGGTDAEENLQALCATCHNDKTAREVRGRLQKTTVPTTIVAGPPGSGKSTYVAERFQPGDLLLDVGALLVALSGLPIYDQRRTALLPFALEARHVILLRLARTSAVRRAWVVTSESNARALRRMADDLGATLIVLAVDAAECVRRIEADERHVVSGADWGVIVARWWDEWRTTGGEGEKAR